VWNRASYDILLLKVALYLRQRRWLNRSNNELNDWLNGCDRWVSILMHLLD
jgi:hypothetical protein